MKGTYHNLNPQFATSVSARNKESTSRHKQNQTVVYTTGRVAKTTKLFLERSVMTGERKRERKEEENKRERNTWMGGKNVYLEAEEAAVRFEDQFLVILQGVNITVCHQHGTQSLGL